jgi:hypothetical protein
VAKRCRRCTTLERSGSALVASGSCSQGWRSASAARMRLPGLRSSMRFSKSRADGETSLRAGAFQLIFSVRMDFHTCCSVQSRTLSQKGNLPVSSWYIMMPALHMSARSS